MTRLIPHVMAFLALMVALAMTVPARALPVDTALVLALDVSASIDDSSYELQRDGLADAIGSPEFGQAVSAGSIGRTAVAVLQWSTVTSLSVAWAVVTGPDDAGRLASKIREMPRAGRNMTCVAVALNEAIELLRPWRDAAVRRVIDVSGDGKEGCGGDVAHVRSKALARDITINSLPIISDEKDVAAWYEANMIVGTGAFSETAFTLGDFRASLERKLIREIASR